MKITDRIDAVTRIPEAWRGAIVPVPPSVKIELTSRCDLKCSFCATSQGLRKKGDMDFGLLKDILRELKIVGVNEIGLFYLGESLLYPKLVEAISFAKEECGFNYVFLTTNGRLLSTQKAYDMMKAGLDSLKFSFNFASREQYKEMTGVDGFNDVIANISGAYRCREEVLKETGHRCGLYASSIKYNRKQLELMRGALARIKDFIDEHYWLPLYSQAGYTTGALKGRPSPGNRGRIGALRQPLPCWALFTEGHITWEGVLTGCCFSHEPMWDFGDLTKASFMEAWNSLEARSLRLANLKKDVRGTACERCVNCR